MRPSTARIVTFRSRPLVTAAIGLPGVRGGFLSYSPAGPVDGVYARNALHQLPDSGRVIALRRIADIWKVVALRRIADMLRPAASTARTPSPRRANGRR